MDIVIYFIYPIFFSIKQPYEFYLIIADIYGNEYFYELILDRNENIMDDSIDRLYLLNDNSVEELTIGYYQVNHIGKITEGSSFNKNVKI